MNDLTASMTQWREGLLSDAEIFAFLLAAMFEVHASMIAKESKSAETNTYCVYGKAEG